MTTTTRTERARGSRKRAAVVVPHLSVAGAVARRGGRADGGASVETLEGNLSTHAAAAVPETDVQVESVSVAGTAAA